jgi:hypothetical protein
MAAASLLLPWQANGKVAALLADPAAPTRGRRELEAVMDIGRP